MTRIIWSPQSLRDVEATCEYIAEDSPHYAGLVVSRIVTAVERLLEFPESGRIVPERSERIPREVVVGRFRAVYRTRADTIEVVTVFRGSRLFPGDL